MNRTPEIKITERNVTGMRYVSPRSALFFESAVTLIMIVALVGIVAMLAVAAGA